jgi:hypothetical protein
LKAEEEKSSILILGPSGMRADVVVHKRTPPGPLSPYKGIIITDVRTTNPCDKDGCEEQLPQSQVQQMTTALNSKTTNGKRKWNHKETPLWHFLSRRVVA